MARSKKSGGQLQFVPIRQLLESLADTLEPLTTSVSSGAVAKDLEALSELEQSARSAMKDVMAEVAEFGHEHAEAKGQEGGGTKVTAEMAGRYLDLFTGLNERVASPDPRRPERLGGIDAFVLLQLSRRGRVK